jgi:hypothetical protein
VNNQVLLLELLALTCGPYQSLTQPANVFNFLFGVLNMKSIQYLTLAAVAAALSANAFAFQGEREFVEPAPASTSQLTRAAVQAEAVQANAARQRAGEYDGKLYTEAYQPQSASTLTRQAVREEAMRASGAPDLHLLYDRAQ